MCCLYLQPTLIPSNPLNQGEILISLITPILTEGVIYRYQKKKSWHTHFSVLPTPPPSLSQLSQVVWPDRFFVLFHIFDTFVAVDDFVCLTLANSVSRSTACLKIWLFTSMTICQIAKVGLQSFQILNKPPICDQRLLKFCQSGDDILLDLVTLPRDRPKVHP